MKSILITGTRKGLGRGLAEIFLEQGWRVFGCSRKEADWSAERYRHFVCDVSDPVEVREMVKKAEKESGGLYGLVNNAGVASMNALLLTPAQSAKEILEVNTLGSFHLMQEVAKGMCRRKSGRIVNISSVASALDLEGEAIYAASKAAVESLTRVAAREFGSFGVTVNAVGPTVIDSDLVRAVPQEKLTRLKERQAVPRDGTVEDLHNLVDFFLKPESSFISGQVIYLGGIR